MRIPSAYKSKIIFGKSFSILHKSLAINLKQQSNQTFELKSITLYYTNTHNFVYKKKKGK